MTDRTATLLIEALEIHAKAVAGETVAELTPGYSDMQKENLHDVVQLARVQLRHVLRMAMEPTH